MLPHARTPLMRRSRSKGVPWPFLLVAVLGILLLLWLAVLHLPVAPARFPASTGRLLEQLHQQQPTDKHGHPANSITGGVVGAQQPSAPVHPSWPNAQRIKAAGNYLQETVRSHKQHPAVAASHYVIEPEPFDMRAQHKKVAAFLKSSAFKAKVAARKAAGQRGIIINAGGRDLVASTVITLKGLREVLHCTLPVELVWHSSTEMDNGTFSSIQAKWGPVMGVDLSSFPWPEHHRPKAAEGPRAWNQTKFLGKVMSLTTSSFASALLLDADNLPLANPEDLWNDESYKTNGNLFWPDFWVSPMHSERQDLVYDMVGLKHIEAVELLSAGKGRLTRDTESGQLLLDLVRHADVAEWALWMNSFGDSMYNAVWGDKDTYALSFAVAGKAHEFNQIQVPPGGTFTWRPDKLLIKATGEKQPGWQLAGMIQFNALGQAAFLHRTMNKFNWGGEAWPLGLLTGPLPLRWINYYLSQDAQGPTVGVPYDYVAPASAFVTWHIPSALATSAAQIGGWTATQEEACPLATFATYWRLREHAVPVGINSTLDAACAPELQRLLGPGAKAYNAAGLQHHPELLALGQTKFDHVILQHKTSNLLVPAEEVPDSTPVLAWATDYTAPAVATSVSRAIAESYEAAEWLKVHANEFEMFKGLGR